MGLLTPLAVRIGAISWMPHMLPTVVWVDNHLRSATRGRVTLLDIAGLPNLVLTVPGRKTGTPRSTPLLCVPDGADHLIAGSYFGAPDEPVWVANLEAAGRATITIDDRSVEVTATRLEGAERDAAWETMVGVWPNFRLYEQRTDRQIKVFRLTA